MTSAIIFCLPTSLIKESRPRARASFRPSPPSALSAFRVRVSEFRIIMIIAIAVAVAVVVEWSREGGGRELASIRGRCDQASSLRSTRVRLSGTAGMY